MNTDILLPLIPFLLGLFGIIIGFTYTKKVRKNDKELNGVLFSYIAELLPVWIYRITYVFIGIMLIAFAIIGWM
ncbi:hypothetical protein [Neobacillus niacini]|uniref:hypothetical protein n=1 Tax=Neobacillus niacini TaxID=86668 RepID=UPI002866B1E5|nr:hypothetical protein [Neobacillus niacini]MDR7001116.1 putative membrane protein [Neobacillus niacini]